MKWECPVNPPCRAWDKVPCKHLESALAKGNRSTSITPRYIGTRVESIADKGFLEIHEMVIPEHIRTGSFEKNFRIRIRKAGLEKHEIDLVTLRFVYDYTLKDICEEMGIPSAQTALNILNRALKTLKKGFGVKK